MSFKELKELSEDSLYYHRSLPKKQQKIMYPREFFIDEMRYSNVVVIKLNKKQNQARLKEYYNTKGLKSRM